MLARADKFINNDNAIGESKKLCTYITGHHLDGILKIYFSRFLVVEDEEKKNRRERKLVARKI